jgi:glycosyltransferase involved in cell wall biosynthesis
VAERAGLRAGPLGSLARWLRDWSVRRAARNVVLGERMAAELKRLVPGASTKIAPNWADGGAIRPVRRHAGKFVIGYSGNFGRVHEFDTVLAAAQALAGEHGLAWSFTGGGHHFARLAQAALPNVTLRGYVPQERLADSLAAADVHLVTLLPALEGLVMPSKFYGVVAAARPVIFVGDPDGEIARLVRRHDIGLIVAPGDVAGLVAAIRSLRADAARCRAMGERARRAFEAEWDKPIALARWRALLEEVSGPAASAEAALKLRD